MPRARPMAFATLPPLDLKLRHLRLARRSAAGFRGGFDVLNLDILPTASGGRDLIGLGLQRARLEVVDQAFGGAQILGVRASSPLRRAFWRRPGRPAPPRWRTTYRIASCSGRPQGPGRRESPDYTGCRARRSRPPCGTSRRRRRNRACRRCPRRTARRDCASPARCRSPPPADSSFSPWRSLARPQCLFRNRSRAGIGPARGPGSPLLRTTPPRPWCRGRAPGPLNNERPVHIERTRRRAAPAP